MTPGCGRSYLCMATHPTRPANSSASSWSTSIGGPTSLLPDVQLILQAWEHDQEADLSGLEDTIDLALAPALFGTQTSIKESTKKESLSGSFNSWKHPASHNLAQTSENVVRALLPETA